MTRRAVAPHPESARRRADSDLSPQAGRGAGSRGDGTSWASLLGCDLIPDGTLEPRLELRQDLLVGRADGRGRGGSRARPRFEVQHQVEQDLQGARIGGGGFVDELLDHRLALGDLPAPAVLGDRHRKITKREAVIKQLVNKSASAD